MPRDPKDRSLDLTYEPAAPPTPSSEPWQLIRSIWDEFLRIAVNLASLDQTIIKFKEDGLALWVAAGYGGVRLDAPTALPDLGAFWTTLPATAAVLTAPRGVVQDFANDGLRYGYQGVWSITVYFAIDHNEVTQSRSIEVRIFNATTATGSVSSPIGIARIPPITNYSVTAMVEVDAAQVGDLFQVQIGNNDILTGVTLLSYSFDASHISEAQALGQ
jgi:hypothetical protein